MFRYINILMLNMFALIVKFLCLVGVTSRINPPNIVFIISDDHGNQDAGFRGSDILTPNMDRLAKDGVILDSHYVMPQCSPTRASLMSGRYPIRTGFWKGNIKPKEEWGLNLNETTVAEMLKRNGYATHAVGKWHIGLYTYNHTPVRRGFDTFFGMYLGSQGYYTHMNSRNYDMREDYLTHDGELKDDIRMDMKGKYNTDIFTDRAVDIISKHNSTQGPLFLYLAYSSPHAPLQVDDTRLEKYTSHMTNSDSKRRKYAAMVSVMDEGIGQVVDALDQYNLRDNTLIVFTADNGALLKGSGSNYPYRGGKITLFEGGVRALSFVNSPLLEVTGYTNRHLHHVVDWFTTFQYLANDIPSAHSKPMLPLDGYNIWSSISRNVSSGREEVLLNMREASLLHNVAEVDVRSLKADIVGKGEILPTLIDAISNEFYVLRWQNWKLFTGNYPVQGWGPTYNERGSLLNTQASNNSTLLFDLDKDPREEVDVKDKYPEVVARMLARRDEYEKNMTTIYYRYKSSDGKTGVWMPWRTQEH